MINGDRNTGEIKKMQFGVLYLKSDLAADTLRLDWERVAGVQSIARYEFETINRDIYVGIISNEPGEVSTPGELKIRLDNGSTIQLPISEIISIREMGQSILSRINLTMDAGVSFTSANKRTQTNFNLSVSFRKPKYSGTLEASSQFSGEEDTEKTARHEVAITATRFLRKKWDAVVIADFLHDNQQELQLRTTLGGGVQRTFYESNRTLFYSIGGAVYTKENYFPEAQLDRNNAEALGALGFSTYRFRGSSFNSLVSVFVSLSDPGRVRVDSNFNWKWDIITDLYWKISFIDNYDNTPPPNGINHNLNITSTVGWSF
ncbi:MAG TPA: DUF481 domain-containing protein [Acidobacteriota bacterium]|nr:DUF481 domain-containing protein [Acidobacteriota bacterium]